MVSTGVDLHAELPSVLAGAGRLLAPAPAARGASAKAAMLNGRVDLYWIPLGAGHHSVRLNGIVYEAIAAGLRRRSRRDLYHSALAIHLRGSTYMVEMTPVPDDRGDQRGVVSAGPVGLRSLGHLRLFRYEIRRWRNGIVPDLNFAVASPIRITTDSLVAQRIFDVVDEVPTPVWGRDELHAGEMWSCNSIISWVITRAGLDPHAIALPPHGRAPGWDAGIAVAGRLAPSLVHEERHHSAESPLTRGWASSILRSRERAARYAAEDRGNTMATATLIARHRVNDYSAWRSVYDSVEQLRQQHGCTHDEVLVDPADREDVLVLHRFPTIEQAEAFAGSQELREAMSRAGVAGPPRIEIAVEA